GDESDVDCGGSTTGAPRCALGTGCVRGDDCASKACNYAKKCVSSRSCTVHHGGDTCGPGPDGDPNGVFEDCCLSLPVPANAEAKYVVDKYIVTAGRVRAFVDQLNGDLK